MINGGFNASTFSYDAIDRLTSKVNPLCSSSTQFAYTYVDQPPAVAVDKGQFRLSQIAYQNGQTANFKYLSANFDERLSEIKHLVSAPGSNGISQYNYGYDAEGEIKNWFSNSLTTIQIA